MEAHIFEYMHGIAACGISASGPATGTSAGSHPSQRFHPIDPRTSLGGGATASMSPCHHTTGPKIQGANSLWQLRKTITIRRMKHKL